MTGVAKAWAALFALSIAVSWSHWFIWAPASHHTAAHFAHHVLFTLIAVAGVTAAVLFNRKEAA